MQSLLYNNYIRKIKEKSDCNGKEAKASTR